MSALATRFALALLGTAVVVLAAAPAVYADSTPTPSVTPSSTASVADGTVSGTITDATTGRPIDQAAVWLILDPSHDGPAVLTGADGRYSISAAPGAWHVSVSGAFPEQVFTYVPRLLGGPTPESSAIDVLLTAGGTAVLDITLTPAGRLSGTVVDQHGHPRSDATVVVFDVHGKGVSSGMGISPAKDGTVTLWVGVAIPTDVRLCAYASPTGNEGDPFREFCSEVVSIAPQQVVTGVRVVIIASTPTPTPTPSGTSGGGGGRCTTQCGGSTLAPTGRDSGLRTGVAGLTALALGTAALVLARRLTPRSR